MDSAKHSALTGDEAEVSRDIGGRFSAFSGYAQGENVELEPDRKIRQTWRASDWPEDHYSTITITLTEEAGGTRLDFIQTGVPESQCEDISQGWDDYYWGPMKIMLEEGSGG